MGEITTPFEVQESRSVTWNAYRGWSGRKVFRGSWEDFPYHSELPQPGDPYDLNHTNLMMVGVEAHQEGNGRTFIATFTFEQDDVIEESSTIGCEVLNTAVGCHWESTGSPVDVPVSIIRPTEEFTKTRRYSAANYDPVAIRSVVGCINSAEFDGRDAETTLFLGADTRPAYNSSGQLIMVTVVYKFLWRPYSQNYTWREARQKLIDNMPQFYQTTDPTGANYTEDSNLDSTPVYVEGDLGTSDWDKIQQPDDSYTYALVDFSTALGL